MKKDHSGMAGYNGYYSVGGQSNRLINVVREGLTPFRFPQAIFFFYPRFFFFFVWGWRLD